MNNCLNHAVNADQCDRYAILKTTTRPGQNKTIKYHVLFTRGTTGRLRVSIIWVTYHQALNGILTTILTRAEEGVGAGVHVSGKMLCCGKYAPLDGPQKHGF